MMSDVNTMARRPGLAEWATATFETRPPGQWRIAPMEGMRGLAVFLVFCAHYCTLIEPWIDPGSTTNLIRIMIHGFGNGGVDLFFVLSGYLIYGILIKRSRPAIEYVLRRVQRIYPAFLAVFVIYVGLILVYPKFRDAAPTEPQALTIYLLKCLFLWPGMVDMEPLMSVAWSLSYEFFFYLTLPVLIWMLRMRAWPVSVRAVFWLASVVMVPAIFMATGVVHHRLLMFVGGILLFETIGSTPPERRGTLLTDVIGFGGLTIGLLLTWIWRERAMLFDNPTNAGGWPVRVMLLFATFYLLTLIAFTWNGRVARLFAWTPARWLGNISYSYYLIHGLGLNALFFLLPRVLPPAKAATGMFWWLIPFAFLASLPLSVVLFILIERRWSLGIKASNARP